MPTPPKPVIVLENEKKSHRTKSELKQRKAAEKALATGTELTERPQVKSNPIAHEEFVRLSGLLKNIDKNDAIYETIINRYCLMLAECVDLEEKRERIYEQAARIEEKLDEMGGGATYLELREATSAIAEIYKVTIACDKQIQSKRKMLLDIEKESIMTIAAALRSIPKKTEDKKSALREALGCG